MAAIQFKVESVKISYFLYSKACIKLANAQGVKGSTLERFFPLTTPTYPFETVNTSFTYRPTYTISTLKAFP